MKQGDFTDLAKAYIHRTGYSLTVLSTLAASIGAWRTGFEVLDLGAGTGKLTANLLELGLRVRAIEPNQAMREEGQTQVPQINWAEGSAENTGLPDNSIDWLLMGSSFHWADLPVALAEFARVLKPGGFFTALWNPRALENNELHARIESRIYALVPDLKRVSSGSSAFTQNLEAKICSTGHFGNLLFMEAPHQVLMTPERYLGAWRSVNDIQAQAGPERFEQVMAAISSEIEGLELIEVPYRTRAWTVQNLKPY
jgi:ubiquinone/menaquinone biosynthesis C-methylase UbiE